MMCETMANVPVEEKASYVLTEDMIDAAMIEQIAYQEELESEGESSSVEESGDLDSQERHVAETNEIIENNVPITNCHIDTENSVNIHTRPSVNLSLTGSPVSNSNKLSVLVIETGLDKNGSKCMTPLGETQKKAQQNTNSVLNSSPDTNKLDCDSNTTNQSASDAKSDPTILKAILSDKGKDGIIDLCESEEEEYSGEDDANETEVIDDELKSVMETNLMAEIGMAMKKTAEKEPQKNVYNGKPRISVKNIGHISTHAFNSISENKCAASAPHSEDQPKKISETENVINTNFTLRNPNYSPIRPPNENNQGPIQINKIAIPHASFVKCQGQNMRCIYVKNTSSLPYVINTPTQTTANNDLRYVMTAQPPAQLKKTPTQMPAITALKNLTKNIQPQSFVLPKNAKLVSIAQKNQKPVNQNVSKMQQKVNNNRLDMYTSSLLSNFKESYTAPDTFPDLPTYTCAGCNDKFLWNTSLVNHVERRSMSIRYWCQICKANLHFFNKCALSIHLRGHKMSLKQIDLSCVVINPTPKEMIDKGITTTFFKDSDSNQSKQIQFISSIHQNKTYKNTVDVKTADAVLKPVPTVSNQTITTVSGQSKSVCYSNSTEVDRPLTSTTAKPQSSNKALPLLLPKSSKPAVFSLANKSSPVQNLTKEPSALANKSQPKSLILFCNKLSQPQKLHLPIVNAIPPNVVCEADSISSSPSTANESNDPEMVVDEDASVMPNTNEDDVDVDVENVDVGSTPTPTTSQSEKKVNGKSKKSTTSGNKRTCSECKAYCPNISKHLNGTGRPGRPALACKICNLILPSKCALKIHHRIHMKIPPYKCPDCGKDFTSWDDLHAHLKFSCGHFAKCIRFICKACKAHFPTQSALTLHIVKNHGKDIFKCSLCPVAFYKKLSLMKHISHDHPKEPNKLDIGLDYKQCEMCPKKLLPQESYIVHAKEHTHSMIYGYKCPMCSNVYANKMAFIIHQIKEKTKRDSLDKSGNQNKKVSVEEELLVSDSNSDIEDEPLIIRRYPENGGDTSVAEKDPLSLDDWECVQEQEVKEKTEELCIVCKKNSVVLLPGIDLNRQSLCCKQCVKPLDDVSSAEPINVSWKNAKSYSNPKCLRPIIPKKICKSSSTDELESVTKKRRTSDISLNSTAVDELSIDPLADSPPRKKSRKKQKDKLSLKGQTHIQGQVIKSRAHNELFNKCSKCEFVSDERESFLEHITVHRTDPNTYQCLECGLCFVVLPSLEIHLQMHHGIKDVSSYTESNKASLPQKASSFEEVETQDNQCRVCYEMFDSKTALDKHFRTHGMAFMSRLSKSP